MHLIDTLAAEDDFFMPPKESEVGARLARHPGVAEQPQRWKRAVSAGRKARDGRPRRCTCGVRARRKTSLLRCRLGRSPR